MTARYVVLHHTGIPQPHYDLMFDIGATERLITWRSPIWPIDRPTTLTRLPDHRREYLAFEGEISGDRGRVDRVAQGQCNLEVSDAKWEVRWEFSTAAFSLRAEDQWIASPLEGSTN